MTVHFTDKALAQRIRKTQEVIRRWAKQNDLWIDAWFGDWIEHFDSPPNHLNPTVFLLIYEGPLWRLFNGHGDGRLFEEFCALVDNSEFHFEFLDHVTMEFTAKDETLRKAYADFFAWKWNQTLIAPDYSLIDDAVFRHFAAHPKDLNRLEPREFEIYLDSVFQSRGYRTELGPGGNDRGIDLRLYSSEVTGEVLTLVQAKRYAESRPIRLEAVQALTATVDYEPAHKGMLVTTSRFLPSARRFAERKVRHISLVAKTEITGWASSAAADILKRRVALLHPKMIKTLLKSRDSSKLEGQIFHARTGYGMIDNEFAICLKATAGAALVCTIPKHEESHDGHHQAGRHVPDTSTHALSQLKPSNVFVAKIKQRSGLGKYLWANRKLYMPWDGSPQAFDLRD